MWCWLCNISLQALWFVAIVSLCHHLVTTGSILWRTLTLVKILSSTEKHLESQYVGLVMYLLKELVNANVCSWISIVIHVCVLDHEYHYCCFVIDCAGLWWVYKKLPPQTRCACSLVRNCSQRSLHTSQRRGEKFQNLWYTCNMVFN